MDESNQRSVDLALRQFEADIELRRSELELKRDELALKREEIKQTIQAEANKQIWQTTPGVAVIGCVVTLLSAIFTNFNQGCNNSKIERQKLQSELIQKAIERAEDTKAAAINLNFLWKAGLITDYEKISKLVEESGSLKQVEPTLPSGQTFGTYFAGIVGDDDRIQINDTTVAPYNAICRLEITGASGKKWGATGFLAGPRLVVTTAHVLYMHPEGFVKSVNVMTVRPGQVTSTVQATEFRVPKEWINNESDAHDYGAILLPSPLDSTGTIELASLPDRDLIHRTVSLAGYPTDKPIDTLWGTEGRIIALSGVEVFHDMDTLSGVSGSPVWIKHGGKHVVVAIHIGTGQGGKWATRLTDLALDNLKKWIAESNMGTDIE